MALPAFLLLTQTNPPPVQKAPVYIGQSRAVVAAMEGAFAKLDDRVLTITSEDGKTTIELLGKRVREDQPTLVWAFDGKQIYVRDRLKHVFVTGKCLRHRAVEVVSKVTGRRVDVVTRALLYRRVPLEEGLLNATVRVLGFAAPGGVPCDIIEADSPIVKTTIFVRRSDHLPQSVSSATIINGNTVSTTERTFTYAKLTVPKFVFSKQPYEKLGAFPVLKPEKVNDSTQI
jgi:hypothetical protein